MSSPEKRVVEKVEAYLTQFIDATNILLREVYQSYRDMVQAAVKGLIDDLETMKKDSNTEYMDLDGITVTCISAAPIVIEASGDAVLEALQDPTSDIYQKVEWMMQAEIIEASKKHSISQSEWIVEAANEKALDSILNDILKFNIKREYVIPMGSYRGRADVALLDYFFRVVALIECKSNHTSKEMSGGREQLKSYLSARDTEMGIFAYSDNTDDWEFYQNLGRNAFQRVSRSDFEKYVFKSLASASLFDARDLLRTDRKFD